MDDIDNKIDENLKDKNKSTPLFITTFIILTLIIWYLFSKSTEYFTRLNFLKEFLDPIRLFYILLSFLILMFFVMKYEMIKVFNDNHTIVFASIAFIGATLLVGSITLLRNVLNKDINSEPVSVFKHMKNFGKMISIFILFGAIVYGILNVSIDNYEISSNILLIVIGIGILIASITFYNYKDKFLPDEDTNSFKILRLIKNIILFIPCFLGHILMNIFRELRDAPIEAYMLLLLEAIVIIIYVFIVPIKNYIYQISIKDGVQLLREPISLSKSETIGSYEQLHKNSSEKFDYKYQYAISFWFYLNPDNIKDEFTPILNYGKKPTIEYNQYNNTLRINMLDGKVNEKQLYITKDVLPQKWNHLVINYSGGTLDIFINNELVSSTPNIIPYMYYDNIVTGSRSNLSGKICNVIYFNKTLSKNTITFLYEFYRQKNPPLLL
tara:strand:+ start:109 stop:1425 length:1317 start_codon:yes stop_codon:yes gene_type:complete